MYYSISFFGNDGGVLNRELRSWLNRNSEMILEIAGMVMIDPNMLVVVYKTKLDQGPLT